MATRRRQASRAPASTGERRITHVLRDKNIRSEIAREIEENRLTRSPSGNTNARAIIGELNRPQVSAELIEQLDSRLHTEAIVLLKTRPVLLVKAGEFGKCELVALEKRLAEHRQSLVRSIDSVGRVELLDHETMDWCGTGWRVESDLIVTNRHVARVFAERHGDAFRFRTGRGERFIRARVDFREEYRQPESSEFSIVKVLWIAPDTSDAPDMAILEIVRDAGLPPPLEIAAKDCRQDDLIAVVGYPARDSRNSADAAAAIFGDVYDVKRFAPGEVMAVPSDTWYFTHDCTTLGGNSGSAVLSVETGEVLGLHYGGLFRDANYAVKASAIKAALRRRAWVPVTPSEFSLAAQAFAEKKRTKASFADRKGFDDGFLGTPVPMPVPGSSHTVLKVGKGRTLDYRHFSVMMSATRHFAIATAVNIDGAKARKLKRKDAWSFDPRIAQDAQVGHKAFYGPTDFDKGHLVRRADPGWGDADEEAVQGEEDSFVYPNAVPQVPQLNQRSWLSLEDYILDNARTQGFRACIFTGPVLRTTDPVHEGIQVPLDFWKVAAILDADTGELIVSAYMLTQDGMMPEEGFRYGPFRTYQVPLSRVERQADLRFSAPIRKADVFAGAPFDETFRAGRFLEIVGPSDVVLTRSRTS